MKQLSIIAVIISIPVPMGTEALLLLSLPVDVKCSLRCLTQWLEHKSKLACRKEHLSASPDSPGKNSLGENSTPFSPFSFFYPYCKLYRLYALSILTVIITYSVFLSVFTTAWHFQFHCPFFLLVLDDF